MLKESDTTNPRMNPIEGFKWEIDVLHYPAIHFICPYCSDTFKRVRSYGKGRIFQYCPSCGMKLIK